MDVVYAVDLGCRNLWTINASGYLYGISFDKCTRVFSGTFQAFCMFIGDEKGEEIENGWIDSGQCPIQPFACYN